MSVGEAVLLAYDRSYPQIGGLERLIAELGSRLSDRYRIVALAKPGRGLHGGEPVRGVEGVRIHWWDPGLSRQLADAKCLIGFGFTPHSPRSIYPLMLARRALAAGVPIAWCPTFSPRDPEGGVSRTHRPGWKRLVPSPLRQFAVTSLTRMYERVFQRAVAIFALTPAEQSYWAARYTGQVALAPHGVGARHGGCPVGPKCRERLAERFGPGPNLLAVGRFVENKNQEVLIRALPLLRQRWPDARLLLVGPDHEGTGPALQALASQAGFAGVEFLGSISDDLLCEYYAGAACVVHAARHEASGLTPLEALAHGTPVLHSGRGALSRYRDLPGCQIVADSESPSAWAAALEKMLDRPDLSEQSMAGREIVLSQHTWEHMASVVATALAQMPRRMPSGTPDAC